MKIVRIGAMWCPACIKMNAYWRNVRKRYEKIEFIDYDLDMDEEKVAKYEIGKILPVVIVEKDNKELQRLIGEKKEEEVVEFIEQVRSQYE